MKILREVMNKDLSNPSLILKQCCTYPANASSGDDQEPSDDDQESSDDGQESSDDGQESSDDGQESSDDDQESSNDEQEPSEDDQESTDGTSCTVRNGALGTCISTSDCSRTGGKSEAGHCPGPSNIQVCS
jgi:hypothetical protein